MTPWILPPDLAKLVHNRSVKEFLLNGLINALNNKLDIYEGIAPSHRGQMFFPGVIKERYLLHQPKCKQSGHMKAGDVIIIKLAAKWLRAKLLKYQPESYRGGSYEWDMMWINTQESFRRYLMPGEDWGVLYGADLENDYDCLDPQVPQGALTRARLVSECGPCQQANMEIYPEEADQFQSFLPFSCVHNIQFTGFLLPPRTETEREDERLTVPRPSQPRLPKRSSLAPNSLPSSIVSSIGPRR